MQITTGLENSFADKLAFWRTDMEHELKIYPKYFEDVLSGKKKFEIRKNDRKVSNAVVVEAGSSDFYKSE